MLTAEPVAPVADIHEIAACLWSADWEIRLLRIQRLLAAASDSLGEDIPYCPGAQAGVDRVDAMIDGCTAMVRELLAEMRRVQSPEQV